MTEELLGARPQVGTKYRGGSVITKIETEVSERPNGKTRTRYIMTMDNGMMMMEDFFDEGKNKLSDIQGVHYEEEKLQEVEFPQDLSASIKFAHSSHGSFAASGNTSCSLSSSDDDDNVLVDDEAKKARKKAARAKARAEKEKRKKRRSQTKKHEEDRVLVLEGDDEPSSLLPPPSPQKQKIQEAAWKSPLPRMLELQPPSIDEQPLRKEDNLIQAPTNVVIYAPRAEHPQRSQQQDQKPKILAVWKFSTGSNIDDVSSEDDNCENWAPQDVTLYPTSADGSGVTSTTDNELPQHVKDDPNVVHGIWGYGCGGGEDDDNDGSEEQIWVFPPGVTPPSSTTSPSSTKEDAAASSSTSKKPKFRQAGTWTFTPGSLNVKWPPPSKSSSSPAASQPKSLKIGTKEVGVDDGLKKTVPRKVGKLDPKLTKQFQPPPCKKVTVYTPKMKPKTRPKEQSWKSTGEWIYPKKPKTNLTTADKEDGAIKDMENWKDIEIMIHAPISNDEDAKQFKTKLETKDTVHGVWGYRPGSVIPPVTSDFNPRDILVCPPGHKPTLENDGWEAQGLWTYLPGARHKKWPPPSVDPKPSSSPPRQVGKLSQKRKEMFQKPQKVVIYPKSKVPKQDEMIYEPSNTDEDEKHTTASGNDNDIVEQQNKNTNPGQEESIRPPLVGVWSFGVGADNDDEGDANDDWVPYEVEVHPPGEEPKEVIDVIKKNSVGSSNNNDDTNIIFGVWGFAPGTEDEELKPEGLWCFAPGKDPSNDASDDGNEFQPQGFWTAPGKLNRDWPPPKTTEKENISKTKPQEKVRKLPAWNPKGVKDTDWQRVSARVYPKSKVPEPKTGESDKPEDNPPIIGVWAFSEGTDLDDEVVDSWDPQDVILFDEGQEPSNLEEKSIPHGLWGFSRGSDVDDENEDFSPQETWVFAPDETPPDDFFVCGVWSYDQGIEDEAGDNCCWPPPSSNSEQEDPAAHVKSTDNLPRRASAPATSPIARKKMAAVVESAACVSDDENQVGAEEEGDEEEKIRIKSTMGRWCDPFNYVPKKKTKKKRGKYI